MRWTVAFPMFPADHLVPMARRAEAAGFDTITVPGLGVLPRAGLGRATRTPPTAAASGRPTRRSSIRSSRSSAMAAVTERIRFLTNVVKLPIRDPLLVAKQLSSMAALVRRPRRPRRRAQLDPRRVRVDAHRHADTRGKRADEMIEIIRLVCARRRPRVGRVPRRALRLRPADDGAGAGQAGADLRRRPVRARAPARRAAGRRLDLGAEHRGRDHRRHRGARSLPRRVRARRTTPFEINALCIDVFDLDGYQRLAERASPSCRPCPGTSTAATRRSAGPARLARPLRRRGHRPVLTAPSDASGSASGSCSPSTLVTPACRSSGEGT